MAAIIRITGIRAFDGDYPLDLEEEFLSNEELHELKKETGIRGGEIQEAMEAGDNDMLVMLAVFAVRRSGKTIEPAVLWKAKFGSIEFDLEEAEGEESLPPTLDPNAGETMTQSDEPPSGETSEPPPNDTAEEPPSPVTQLHTGPPHSDTSAISGREISAG